MTPKSSAKSAARNAKALEGPAYPALRCRGIAALVVTLVLILGLALFIALMREGRTTLGGISATWVLYFAITFTATVGWSLAGVLLVAFAAQRRVDDVSAGYAWTHRPLLAPATLALMAFVSDVANRRLVQTDDLRWIWAASVGAWAALLCGSGLALASPPLDAYGGLFGSIFDISMTALSIRSLSLLMLFLGMVLAVRGTRPGADPSA